ncbi:MAG: hypothetical protein QM811_26865 [Pirellulales bacterium]
MSTNSPDPEEIRRRMQAQREAIRLGVVGIKSEVADVKSNIRESLDWRKRIARNPYLWGGLAGGAALVIGYALVPGKLGRAQKEIERLREVINDFRFSAQTSWPEIAAKAGVKEPGMLGNLFDQGKSFLKQAAVTQIKQQGLALLTGWLAARAQKMADATSDRSPGSQADAAYSTSHYGD